MPNHFNEPTPKPLGDLSFFPRELRDEIYRHVFSKTYKAFYSSSIVKPAYYDKSDDHSRSRIERDREERTGSDLSILRLQKAINTEAMSLLYSETTFRFHHNVRPDYYLQSPQSGIADIAKRMTQIAISCDVGRALEIDSMVGSIPAWSSLGYRMALAGPLQFFQGVFITRESILVDLRLHEWSINAANLTVSPFFEALKQLTGFKTVTLRLTSVSDYYCPAKETSRATIEEFLEAGQWEKLYAGFGPLLCTMSDALEPALGNRSEMELLVSPWHAQCYTTFHPQAHLAAISKATNMQQLPVTT